MYYQYYIYIMTETPESSPSQTKVYVNRRAEKDGVLTFTLVNIDVSIANALRRTILSDIPTIGFRTFPHEKNEAHIHKNTSRFNNEILKQRLSCIPIHITDFNLPYNELLMVVKKENTGKDIMYVTTEDFKIKNTVSDKFLTDQTVRKIFPPDPYTKDYILFARLRPKISNEVPGEIIHIEAAMSLQTAKHDAVFNVVSCASYGMTPDRLRQDALWQKKLSTLTEKNDPVALEMAQQDWQLHDAQRIYKPNSFDFRIESIGVFDNIYIVVEACNIIIHRLEIILKEQPEIKESSTTMSNSFDVLLRSEGYTIGKLLEFILQDLFYKQQRTLIFVAFLKKHPHDTDSLIRMALVDENGGETNGGETNGGETNGEIRIAHMINTACQKGIEIIKEIVSDFQ